MTEITAEVALRLAALNLSREQMAEVIAVISDLQVPAERKREKDRVRKAKARRVSAEVRGIPRKSADTTPTTHTSDAEDERNAMAGIGQSDGGVRGAYRERLTKEDLFLDSESSLSMFPRKRVKKTIGHRLPDDWMPTIDDLAFARSLLPAGKVESEVDRFRDHWHASAQRNAIKNDWVAAWRNWIRNEVQKLEPGGQPNVVNASFGSRRSNPTSHDARVAGMAAALSERPDSRLAEPGGIHHPKKPHAIG